MMKRKGSQEQSAAGQMFGSDSSSSEAIEIEEITGKEVFNTDMDDFLKKYREQSFLDTKW